jgi:hypothetical protein
MSDKREDTALALLGRKKKQRNKKERYRTNLIPIHSYQTQTLSSSTALCNEYKRKKLG